MTKRQSFIPISDQSDFPLENLPYGVFSPTPDKAPRVGVALGDQVLDMAVLEAEGLLEGTKLPSVRVFDQPTLNAFMELGHEAWASVRKRLQDLLANDTPTLRDNRDLRARAFYAQSDVVMHLPVRIGDYTDFYSSKHHAFNVGTMFRGADNALMPNYLHVPIAYHGRASSVILSGQDIHRPIGQTKPKDAQVPQFGPCKLFDFELEMGFFIGTSNTLGNPVNVDEAEKHIFGFVLVNDWSARDIQTWEYQPLGPFNAKNFATSISPWVVTMDALRPFRVPGPDQDPEPFSYLKAQDHWTLDIKLDVLIQSETMDEPHRIARSNYHHLYWTPSQHVAHHTITGCNLQTGDLLASGTISGPEKEERGSMLELSWRGTEPVELPGGETRKFIQDGDTVFLRGFCERDGVRIGFGEVAAKLLPSKGV
ncbi:fumarylacetoacetase [bacterium]|nr:fumarylacetoacetase [bacterium]